MTLSMSSLQQLENIPFDYAVLISLFPEYKSLYSKVEAMERSGKIIRLKRGLYVNSPNKSEKLLSMELIANHIYGPSYVSRETALRYYGLIPESVFLIRSMTTKHTRSFKNSLGEFEYTSCSKDYFSIGIRKEISGNATFLIASPEKALCDLICSTAGLNIRFQKDVIPFLEEYFRFDMEAFFRMDVSIFERCAKVCKKAISIHNIIKILKR